MEAIARIAKYSVSRAPHVYVTSKVVTASNWVTILTSDEFENITNHAYRGGRDIVLASNGNGDANQSRLVGVAYVPSTNSFRAFIADDNGSPFQIQILIVCS